MNKVILVSYNFPPVGGAGVQRPVKFVKYLREFGWEPVVITVANPSVPVEDNTLCKDIPDGVRIYKAVTFEPSYSQKKSYSASVGGIGSRIKRCVRTFAGWFMVPDVQILWWPGLITQLILSIWKEKPSCLFVTAPPFSSFIPVVFLGSLLRIPVVVDFRDEWSFCREQWENSTKTRFAVLIDRLLERYIVSQCTAITAVNGSYLDAICLTHPGVSRTKGTVITNGYDTDDFVIQKVGQDEASNKIQIVYTGTIWRGNSLKSFVDALKLGLSKDSSFLSHFDIKLYGRAVDSELDYLQDEDLSGIVEYFEYQEHDKIVKIMSDADILLLVISDLPGAQRIIVGKTFEYMATGKHILAIVPDGETKNLLLDNYNKVTVVNYNDIHGIYMALKSIIESISAYRNVKGSDVSNFSRVNLTRTLAGLFDTVAKK